MYLLDLFVRMGEKGQCDLVCGAPLDDWANAGLCRCPMHHVHVVSVVLTFWVVGPVLRNVWNLETKSILHCFRKVKCQLDDTPESSLPEINVRYKFLEGIGI